MIGKTISHYKIIEKIGEGGMGVVLKAEDTKLKRTVAIKLLPPQLTRDKDAKQRFIQEAQAASVLEHNNICNIHEIDETEDGQTFIVMACYEGETLKERIKRGPLEVEEAIDITIQIAHGLAKAHREGIVHRDIKPANVFVTSDGVVKIVDFGMAKLTGQVRMTKAGTTVGTVAYMSPEQTRGNEVDQRTDIWSLGIVLYEMVTGQLPFEGDYEQAVIYSIMNEEPEPMTELRTDVPFEIERVVREAMVKNPDERYQHVEEMRNDLQDFRNASVPRVGTKKFPRRMFKTLLAGVTGVFLLVLVILVYLLIQQKENGLHIKHTLPLTTAPGLEQDPSWSPDGTRIAYTSDEGGNMDIWVLQIAAGQSINLTKDHVGYDGKPAWSPDGSELIYAISGSLYSISSRGGEASPLPLPSTGLIVGYSEPVWSPDGNRIACTGFVAMGVSTSQIWSLHRNKSDPIPVTSGRFLDHNPVWSPNGKRIFFISDRGGSADVWWVAVNVRGEPTGEAQPLTSGAGIGTITLSEDGRRLAYTKSVEQSNICSIPIVLNRKVTLDEAIPHTSENNYIESLDISPDGKWIAFDSNRRGNMDLWIMRKDGTELRQLTTDKAHDWYPRWSPDGKKILFHSFRNGNRDLFEVPVSGGPVKQLTNHPAEDLVSSWSPNGERIAFVSNRSGSMNLWMMQSNGKKVQQLTFTDDQDLNLVWSPDGKEIAFCSNRTGFYELFSIPEDQFLIPKNEDKSIQLTYCKWAYAAPLYWAADSKTIYVYGVGGPDNKGANLFAVSRTDGSAQVLIDFQGSLKEPSYSLYSDKERIYFPLWERSSDLWMAEVIAD